VQSIGAHETNIPGRLDRLPWSGFHWLVIAALGGSWILDGLEVTLVGSLSAALTNREALGLGASEVGFAASAYLAGAILGAIGFGYLADRFGRKPLYVATVLVYALGTMATGASWNFMSFLCFRFVTGAGIGGEYAAINSAIQELIPARCRGWTDLAVNGSFWAGAILGAAGAMVAADPGILAPSVGWRLAFLTGGVLALIIIALRRYVPESPRWLVAHGRLAEAEAIVSEIEARAGSTAPAAAAPPTPFRSAADIPFFAIAIKLVRLYPRRVLVGIVLMGSQAFLFNAVFFTYAMILSRFYGVSDADVGRYMIAFAVANLLGPLLLGPLFDSVGRKPMIAATYAIAGLLLGGAAILFDSGLFTAVTQTAAWMAIFFVASAAASAAYLTVGETFPVECRAATIAFFYAFGTAVGGLAGPAVFGLLIGAGSRHYLTWGYLAGAGLMVIAAAVEAMVGISAERMPLEAITPSLGQGDPSAF